MSKTGNAVQRTMFVTLFLAAGATALAQSAPDPIRYEPNLKSELILIGVAGGAALVPVFIDDKVDKICPCDASSVNGFDRGTAGRRSTGFDRASYVPVILAGIAPVLPVLTADSKRDAFADALVTGQAVLVNVAINQWVKVAAERPRPFIYGLPADAPELQEPENYLSFYSQHTSVAFAAGVSYARTFALRHPNSRYRWVAYVAAFGTGAAAGTFRVLAGKHFPTDVLTGAAAGTAIGFALPWLRSKPDAPQITVLPTRSGATFSVRFAN